MKRAAAIVGVLSAAITAAWGQNAEKKAEEPKPISGLSWLVGGVWRADASKMSPGMRIETRYRWSDNNTYIRFTTHFVFDKGTAKTYDGNFFWNPTHKTLAMWYMDAKNGITEGPVEVIGEVTKLSFHGPDFEGKEADLHVFVRRKSNDDYRWSVEERQGETWKEVAPTLEYLRGADN